MYIGCLCKLQATTHFLYSVCANSRPPLYLLACANSRLVSTYIYLSYLFPSPTTIIWQLPALSPQHQVNTRPDPLQFYTLSTNTTLQPFSVPQAPPTSLLLPCNARSLCWPLTFLASLPARPCGFRRQWR